MSVALQCGSLYSVTSNDDPPQITMTPRERWQVGLGVLTAYVGPADRRAADITRLAGERDPREVLFGVLAVAKDLLGLHRYGSRRIAPASCGRSCRPE